MPFYHAHVRPGLLDLAGRSAFSNDVVQVHCGVTGAPPSFVHVMITEDSGSLPEGQNGRISSTIRAGRTDEQKAEMRERLSALLAQRARVDAATISATSRDIEASFTMEGGALGGGARRRRAADADHALADDAAQLGRQHALGDQAHRHVREGGEPVPLDGRRGKERRRRLLARRHRHAVHHPPCAVG